MFTPIVDFKIANCIDKSLMRSVWRAWREDDRESWTDLRDRLKQQLAEWLRQAHVPENNLPVNAVFQDLGIDQPDWLEKTFSKDHSLREERPRPLPESWFDLLLQIQTLLKEALVWRRIFWRRDDDPRKFNLVKDTINLAENCQIEVIYLNEFLKKLGDTFGTKRRIVFQAKALGFTFQEIADFLEIGRGSVRYHWGEALNYYKSF